VRKLRFIVARLVMGYWVETYGTCSCGHEGNDHGSGQEPYPGEIDCFVVDCPCPKWMPVSYDWSTWWRIHGRNQMFELQYRLGL